MLNKSRLETEKELSVGRDLSETDKLIVDENETISIQKISKIGNNVFIYI